MRIMVKIVNFFNNVQKILFYPLLFAGLMVLVKIAEQVFHFEGLYRFGILPRQLTGLPGVFLSPLIHGDFWHLFSNVVPLVFLSGLVFHFYKPLGYRVLLAIILSSGLWTWALGRPSYHIGASGVVYGLVFFIFFSGLIRKHNPLRALGLVVVFLYGSLFWGMFPIDPHVSWEAHLSGAAGGLLCAWWFRKRGPQAQEFVWPEEEDELSSPAENEGDDTILNNSFSDINTDKVNSKDQINAKPEMRIVYTFKESDSGKTDPREEHVNGSR